MANTEGALILPKRITLGNALSIGTTIVSAAVVVGVIYGTFGLRLTSVEAELAKAPSTYATQADLKLVQEAAKQLATDQKDASRDVRDGLSALVEKTSATNSTIAGLTATIAAMQGTMTEIRRTLEDRRRVQATTP